MDVFLALFAHLIKDKKATEIAASVQPVFLYISTILSTIVMIDLYSVSYLEVFTL